MMQDFLIYGGLFLNALAAGSVLPVQSEALLTLLLLDAHNNPTLLVGIATIGNTCGAVINWLLGYQIEKYHERKWFPASPEQLVRARNYYARFGRWSLLLSWVPLIGDALTVIAGVMREKLWIFVLIVAVGKALRYGGLAIITLETAKLF